MLNIKIQSNSSVLLLCVMSLCLQHIDALNLNFNEENETLQMVDIIKDFGYPVQVHTITTEDGYILRTFRITNTKNRSSTITATNLQLSNNTSYTNAKRPVIFLMHGMFSSAYEYICNGPNKSLGLLLVDVGYDVWLGNARGNIFSRNHRRLNPDKDVEFWQYSWNEIGMFDVPANIDYITNVTGEQQISYVGTSQGTTSFMVMCSEKPEYNRRIKVMVALAPVVYLGHVKGIVKEVVKHLSFFKWLIPRIGLWELYPKPIKELQRQFIRAFCNNGNIFQAFCIAIPLSIVSPGNFTYIHSDKNMIPTYLKFPLTGVSAQQVFHYGQIIKTGSFEKYDYGRELNMKKYNSEMPPIYNLSKVVVPVALFYGDGDIFAEQIDIDRLNKELSNVILNYKIPYREFHHFDYIVASGAVEVLYNIVIGLLSSI